MIKCVNIFNATMLKCDNATMKFASSIRHYRIVAFKHCRIKHSLIQNSVIHSLRYAES